MSGLFDVVITDGVKVGTFRHGISKSDAKKIVKDLRKKGYKAQLVTCKDKEKEIISIQEESSDEE